jgi:hypothetical protein
MWTTLGELMQDLADLQVDGVNRSLPHPPEQINTDELPMLYVRLPQNDTAQMLSFQGNFGIRSVTLDLVILVTPLNLGSAAKTTLAVAGLLDALHNAFVGEVDALGLISYQMRVVEADSGGSTLYWGIICTVTCSAS